MLSCERTRGSRRCMGLTLVELLVATAILAMLAVAVTGLVSAGLSAHQQGLSRARLYTEASRVMDRLADRLAVANSVLEDAVVQSVTTSLVLTGFENDDGDFFFDDPLFPRVDEDPHGEVLHDGKPGIKDMDDDGDGQVDEGDNNDDDEDNIKDEDGVSTLVYWVDPERGLCEGTESGLDVTVVSENVTRLQVVRVSTNLFRVELALSDASGNSLSLQELLCARNVLQNTGKRVR